MGNDLSSGDMLAKSLLNDLIDENDYSMVVTKRMWQETRQEVSNTHGPCNDNLIEFLNSYQHVFSYEDELDIHGHRRITVEANPDLRVCQNHIKKRGRCAVVDCDSLHCCKFYLAGRCKFDGNCKFGHSLLTPHNYQLLAKYCLQDITPPKLGQLLEFCEKESDGDSSDGGSNCASVSSSVHAARAPEPSYNASQPETVPKCCTFYNSNRGCRHGDSDKCRNVHICKNYMMGDCKFGGRDCSYSHDLHNPQAKAVLLKFGINSDRVRVSDILDQMRSVVQVTNNEKQASSPSEVPKPQNAQSRRPDNIQCKGQSIIEDSEMYPEICIFYLRDDCNYASLCKRYHTQPKLPYHWQHKVVGSDGRWVSFSNERQSEIEQCFCDPAKDDCIAQDNGSYRINFKDMKFYMKSEQRRSRAQTGDIRRLSTKSCVGMTEQKQFTTLWRWYWIEDDGRWIEFGYTKYGKKVHGSLSSRDIEEHFTSDPSVDIEFSRGRFGYELHLRTMSQVNMGTKNEREIRRRPAPFDQPAKQPMKSDFTEKSSTGSSGIKDLMSREITAPIPSLLTGKSAEGFHAGKTIYPAHWTSSSAASLDCFQIVPIHPFGTTSKEYTDISQLFKATMPDKRLKSVLRIQNVELWDAFYRKRSWMEKKLLSTNVGTGGNEGDATATDGRARGRGGNRGGRIRAVSGGRSATGGGNLSVSSLNVQRLFHGTKKSIIDAICQQGFDWRVNGTSVGTIYGKGSYFAKQASYSAAYTDCRTLFVAQVLVGAYTQGLPTYVRPPPKNPNKPMLDLYDSCVDNMVEPNIFVVFAQEQAYPEYLIEY